MPITPEQQQILDELAAAAVDLEVLFVERATITALGAPTTTRTGDRIRPTVDKHTDVPANISSGGTGTERLIAQSLQVVEPYIVSLPIRYRGLVDEADTIVIGARSFEIKSIPEATYAVQVRCICEETS